jgi:hypothetical protein
LSRFHQLLAELPPALQSAEQNLRRYIDGVCVETDVRTYAEQNRNAGFVIPSDIPYQPYVAENPAFASLFSTSASIPISSGSSSNVGGSSGGSAIGRASTVGFDSSRPPQNRNDPSSRVFLKKNPFIFLFFIFIFLFFAFFIFLFFILLFTNFLFSSFFLSFLFLFLFLLLLLL